MIFCKIVNLEYVAFYLQRMITTLRITTLVKTNSHKAIITFRPSLVYLKDIMPKSPSTLS